MVKRRKLSDASKPPSNADEWVQSESPAPTPQTPSAPPPPLAKSKNPDYQKMGLYARKDVYLQAKIKAMQEGQELSQVVEDLLVEWLGDQAPE